MNYRVYTKKPPDHSGGFNTETPFYLLPTIFFVNLFFYGIADKFS